jgi:hypothetical protein
LLVIYDKNNYELVFLDDKMTEPTDQVLKMLTILYGHNDFGYIVDTNSIEELHGKDINSFYVSNQNNSITLVVIKKIIVTTDKPNNQITADGSDTCTITATVDDPNSTEMIELVNGTEVYEEQAVNGVATFQVTMTEPGELKLLVRSTTKYGEQEIIIKGVSA